MSARDHFLDEFARVAPALPGHGQAWLERARGEALAAFAAHGLPTQRDEDWKYTSLAALENSRFTVAPRPPRPVLIAQTVAAFALADAHLMVFVDGRFEPRLSRLAALPAGVTLASLADIVDAGQPGRTEVEARLAQGAGTYGSGLAALNAAFMADGAYVHLPPGAAPERPIELLSIVTTPGLAVHLRHLVRAEAGSRACIVEHYFGAEESAYLINASTDIAIGRDARIEHCRLQDDSRKAIHVAALAAEQRRGSEFASNAFAFGAALSRADIGVTLAAPDARCALNGLYVVRGRQHVDHHTHIDHAQPRGTSRELYKGIVDEAARAVFNGRVVVRAHAQQSDAHQSNRNLLLSEAAEVDTKPQLEIHADDVKCSHGATVGQLDAEQLYYLRSRGVDAMTARALLIHAFAVEVIARAGSAPLRARLERRLVRALGGFLEPAA